MPHSSWGVIHIFVRTCLLVSTSAALREDCEHAKSFNLMVCCLCRDGSTRVLITTDVWARGLDVQQVCLGDPNPYT